MRAGRILRPLAAILGAALLLVGTALPLGAQQQRLRMGDVNTDAFPEVAVTITFDEPVRLGASDVRVLEDGTEAHGVAVRPIGTVRQRLDVVLALDVSGSMRGEPLAAAAAAATEFVQGLPRDARVGVVTFATEPIVVRSLTSDRRAVIRALESLSAQGKTALYDAVVSAAGMFSGSAQRSIVLLSDGGNNTSAADLGTAVEAARDVGAAVFTVGLQTPDTDFRALRTIAASTGGTHARSEAADLVSIFRGLSVELSNEFLVTYRSSVEEGREFTLVVSALGLSDSISLVAPRSLLRSILGGTIGLVVALLLIFLGVFIVAVLLLGTEARRRRESILARQIRVTPGRPAAGPGPEPEQSRGTWLPDPLAALGERLAGSGRFAQGLDRALERAGLPLRAGEFLMLQILAALLGAALGALVQGLLFVVTFALVAALAPRAFLAYSIRRRRNALHEQLADVLMLLSSSLRAGYSFLQALDLVSKEVGEPGAQEFRRVVAEIRLGRPVEEALEDMAERVDSDDFRWAVMAVNVQREVGGNLAEVLDTVAETVRDRQTIRRQVRVLSAEARFSAWILTALPFVIVLYMARVNPDYMRTLITHRLGIVMIAIGSALILIGFAWMRRMVKIDV